MLYRERMRQAHKEAKIAAAGVAGIIACWGGFGFGLHDVDIQVFSTPLWIVMGCLGTWVVALIFSIILATKVIEDCPLDEDDFGRKYQPEDQNPVELSPMTIDYDMLKQGERSNIAPRVPRSEAQAGRNTSERRRS